jgi:hypothetical protein
MDEFINVHGISVVEYFHCDVQGLDLSVIRSFGDEIGKLLAGVAETALTKRHAIYSNQKDTLAEMLTWLTSNGFDVVRIDPNDPWMIEWNVQFCKSSRTIVVDGIEHKIQVGTIGGY